MSLLANEPSLSEGLIIRCPLCLSANYADKARKYSQMDDNRIG